MKKNKNKKQCFKNSFLLYLLMRYSVLTVSQARFAFWHGSGISHYKKGNTGGIINR